MQMNDIYSTFKFNLNNYNKALCVNQILDLLNSNSISIVDLYSKILTPSLNSISSDENTQTISIWEEHLQSEIVRTIVELSYPYIIKSSNISSKSPVAIVCCLYEEYHELGARMTTDFLTLLGFNAYFIGANTPKSEIFKTIETLNPTLISISVTNYFHLSKLQDFILELKDNSDSNNTKPCYTVVGGYAIDHTPNAKLNISADFFASSYEDLAKIKEVIL